MTYYYDSTPVMGFLTIIVVVIVLYCLFSPRRTKEYRRCLTDLYVAGRIRQVADKDKINLSDEYETYKQFVKKKRMEDWELDVTVEEELKEELTKKKKDMKEIK